MGRHMCDQMVWQGRVAACMIVTSGVADMGGGSSRDRSPQDCDQGAVYATEPQGSLHSCKGMDS
jgi:hypothetical protein